jgi:L-lactate dehydrogenase complex protein LldG
VSERERVLARVRTAQGRAAHHPGPFAAPPRSSSYTDFSLRVHAIGGEAHGPFALSVLATELARLCAAWAPGGRVATAGRAAEILRESSLFERVDDHDPHGLEDVKIAVLLGSHGIAESGAVLVEHRTAPVRALALLCERLVLLLPSTGVVSDLHAALSSLGPEAFAQPHLTWIAGPSKTADIEQALVHGAHGARAFAVVGIEE